MTYLALYREWRPQVFGDIIGQEHITRTLRNAVEGDRAGHAYLFCGTRGTGKTTTAKVLAKALNCLSRQGAEPCNKCDNCKAITGGFSVDVIEVDAASNRGIDEIRDLREKIKFAPSTGRYRVYIIDEVHMLTSEAFNALLKTLEEPPRHAVLILATTEPHKVPLTILSRCQRFNFKRIIPADIIGRLKEVAAGARLEVEEEALRLIARAAEGGLRDALSILDQAAAFGNMKIMAGDVHDILGTARVDALSKMAGRLAAGEAGHALRLVAGLAGEGKDLRLFAREMAAYLRALLLEKISPGASSEEVWDEPAQMAARAAEFAMEGLVRSVEIMARAEQEMKWSALPDVILELALVRVCRQEEGNGMDSLAARLEVVEEGLKKLAGHTARPGRGQVVPEAPPRLVGPSPENALPVSKDAAGAGAKEAPGATGRMSGQDWAAGEVAATASRNQDKPAEKGGAGTGEGAVALEQVRESWGAIMDTIKREQLPLYHNYTTAIPLAVRGRRGLVVGFPAGEELAREMAESPDNKKYLEGLLCRHFEGEWQVAFTFYQEKANPPKKRQVVKEQVTDVKRRFGGEEITLDDESEGTLF